MIKNLYRTFIIFISVLLLLGTYIKYTYIHKTCIYFLRFNVLLNMHTTRVPN